MDNEMLSPCFFPLTTPSELSPVHIEPHHNLLKFASCSVPEQWLLGDIVVRAPNEEDGEDLWPPCSSLPAGLELPLPSSVPTSISTTPPQPAATRKLRGRKPKPRPEVSTVSHVVAERQRRDKLNRRFCDLRAAVPTVSRMDKASLLADATAYIKELHTRVARLEEENRQASAARWENIVTSSGGCDQAVEVRMVGRDVAAVRVTTAAPHAPGRLMGAFRSLDLEVQHACVSRVQGVTVQDAVVDVPGALQDDAGAALRSALLLMLHDGTT